MIFTFPDYYEQFECIADSCEDTCCAGWQIMIDDRSYRRYMNYRGPYRSELRKRIDRRDHSFQQDSEKRCAFLNNNNLCNLYTNLGKSSLCKTCKNYPRHIEEFENVREVSLSLSCPEVARIFVDLKSPVRFITKERGGEETYDDFDPFLFSTLQDARDTIIKLLQDRSIPVAVRACLTYGLAHDLQKALNEGRMFECMDVIERYTTGKARDFCADHCSSYTYEDLYSLSEKLFEHLTTLENLRDDWLPFLAEAKHTLFSDGPESFRQLITHFEETEGSKHSILLEQLLVYFVFTYFCGAVYDGNPFAKINSCLADVIAIYLLFAAIWKQNDHALEKEDIISIIYRYSREIEHSDENLTKMERFRL